MRKAALATIISIAVLALLSATITDTVKGLFHSPEIDLEFLVLRQDSLPAGCELVGRKLGTGSAFAEAIRLSLTELGIGDREDIQHAIEVSYRDVNTPDPVGSSSELGINGLVFANSFLAQQIEDEFRQDDWAEHGQILRKGSMVVMVWKDPPVAEKCLSRILGHVRRVLRDSDRTPNTH